MYNQKSLEMCEANNHVYKLVTDNPQLVLINALIRSISAH